MAESFFDKVELTPLERAVRLKALHDAARDVCGFCGGRYAREWCKKVSGPNEAGNYTHKVLATRREILCEAHAVWARIRFEFGAKAIDG